MKQIQIEGLTPDEIEMLPDELMDGLVLCGEPLAFRAGSAEILGQFSIVGTALVIELAHIDGGGEGVLPTLWAIAHRYGRRRNLTNVDWRIHAINCAKPNPKLQPLLERKGFVVEDVVGTGVCYRLVRSL
ncbi:MAG: hypothetical protein AB1489_32050 [Acidobacteriota bacterium]